MRVCEWIPCWHHPVPSDSLFQISINLTPEKPFRRSRCKGNNPEVWNASTSNAPTPTPSARCSPRYLSSPSLELALPCSSCTSNSSRCPTDRRLPFRPFGQWTNSLTAALGSIAARDADEVRIRTAVPRCLGGMRVLVAVADRPTHGHCFPMLEPRILLDAPWKCGIVICLR